MQNHPVVIQLRKGCRELHVPEDAAIALLQFRMAKRAFPKLPMSPSTTLQALWHWALLETDVIAAVHELVGGAVRHTRHAPHDCVQQRRLIALTVIESMGFTPNLDFWHETDREGQQYPVRRVPLSGCHAMRAVYVERRSSAGDVGHMLQLLRLPREELQVQRGPDDWISTVAVEPCFVIVRTLTGTPYTVHLRSMWVSVKELKEQVEEHYDAPVDSQRLVFANHQLEDGRSLADCGIVCGMMFHLTRRLRGC